MNYLRQFFMFIDDLIKSRNLIIELTNKDFQKRYLGSYLGIFWAFVQPMVTILIFWFVFQVGFKSAPIGNIPFVLWITTGFLPWFFFSESFSSATNSIVEYSYLVSKIVFRVSILPIIKVFSALFIHLFFVVILFIMFYLYGYKLSIYNIQIVYYLVATFIFLLGISWITSALVVFLRDVGHLVGMFLQFGFWMTPIFWNINTVPAKYQTIIKLNPLFYIIEGYRNTFIYHQWFWQTPRLTIYFWIVNIFLFILGAIVFRRLRPHFADVL